ncbi:MAG: RNA pyrophosphohydrolase, partial [Betaproteobacteria bacterium HGW-Betaproteobacteria-17]
YWVPLESVIEFKRDVYRMALNELSHHLNHDHPRRSANKPAAETRQVG